jgi:hypothetical protein
VRLHAEPLTLAAANETITRLHRHHGRVAGHRFSIGVFDDQRACRGVAVVGRPVGGGHLQMVVAEVTRLATDGTPNACSLLYAAAARAAQAMGYLWIQTFILAGEPGTSLRAAGWQPDGLSHPAGWGNGSRPRNTVVEPGRKQRWKRQLNTWDPGDTPALAGEGDLCLF